MILPVALTVTLNLLTGAAMYLARAMRRDLPLTGWLDRLPAPHWPHLGIILDRLTVPLRMSRRATGQHAAPLLIVWDERAGRYRHGETGPMPVIWDQHAPFPVVRAPEGGQR